MPCLLPCLPEAAEFPKHREASRVSLPTRHRAPFPRPSCLSPWPRAARGTRAGTQRPRGHGHHVPDPRAPSACSCQATAWSPGPAPPGRAGRRPGSTAAARVEAAAAPGAAPGAAAGPGTAGAAAVQGEPASWARQGLLCPVSAAPWPPWCTYFHLKVRTFHSCFHISGFSSNKQQQKKSVAMPTTY